MWIANIPWSLPWKISQFFWRSDKAQTAGGFLGPSWIKQNCHSSRQANKPWHMALLADTQGDLKRHEAVLPGHSHFCWHSTSDQFPNRTVGLATEVAHSCAKARLLWTIVEPNDIRPKIKATTWPAGSNTRKYLQTVFGWTICFRIYNSTFSF